MREVERVLDEIGAGEVEQVVVFNKIDRLDETERPRVLVDSVELPSGRRVPRLFLSAVSGEGLEALRECIATLAVREPGAGSLNRAAGASPEEARPRPATKARTFASAPIIRTPDGARPSARLPDLHPPMTLPPSFAAEAAPLGPWAALASVTRALLAGAWARLVRPAGPTAG
jgi:hypothetical protein